MFRSIHPYNQLLIEEFQPLHAPEVQIKIERAERMFKEWRTTSITNRSSLMMNVATILRKNKERYAKTITLEMGKTISEARSEVEKCANGCEFFAQNAERFLADEAVSSEASRSMVAYQPIGAVLAIMPWNFPFWQVFRFAAPALMAGNVGLLKHAPNVTRCSLLLEEIFKEAGFPDGVFQSLVMDVDLVSKVLEAPIVQGVALTGSELAGSKVGALAGQQIKKAVLELGGSDPFIVLADADLDSTLKVAVQSRMQNAGQSCIAAKRFIVSADLYVEFLQKFTTRIEALKQGDPFDEETQMGPLARIDLAEKLSQQIERSVQAGARLVTGGTRKDCNFAPSLLADVAPGMPAFDEEMFGPVACVCKAESESEMIALANASRYGLGASIWTKNSKRGEQLARQIEAGSVFVNSLMRSDVRLPFGGIKKSGYGRELSEAGIREFVNVKTLYIS